jgi:hypothetical protein
LIPPDQSDIRSFVPDRHDKLARELPVIRRPIAVKFDALSTQVSFKVMWESGIRVQHCFRRPPERRICVPIPEKSVKRREPWLIPKS